MYANSADSHVLEPQDLWISEMPPSLRERALRVTLDGDEEIATIDGVESRRARIESGDSAAGFSKRPPGHDDPAKRIADLESQGVWAELLFPSLGLWIYRCDDPTIVIEHAKVYNDWLLSSFMKQSERFVGVALLPLASVEDAIAEVHRTAGLGYQAVNIPAWPPVPYNDNGYEDLWSALEETGVRLCCHVGTGADPVVVRGLGGAVINYTETFFPPQRLVAHFVTAGILDRHPGIQLLVIEGGASWLPALMERMDEGYIQHERFVRPKLSELPSEIVKRQVHASFQHDRALLSTIDITGVGPLLWGSDYPHYEGTWPDTKQELETLFATTAPDLRHAVTAGNFESLFRVPPQHAKC